jgi:hypothetical protein
MESARESKRKATTEAKSSSSTAPAVQHERMAVDARQSDETNSAVMPHEKRSLVVNDDDNDNDNDVTHPAEANQKGDFDSDDNDSNSSGLILIMLKSKEFRNNYFVRLFLSAAGCYSTETQKEPVTKKKSSALLQTLLAKQPNIKKGGRLTIPNLGTAIQSLVLSPTPYHSESFEKIPLTTTIPADVIAYPFKVLTAGTLEENETTLHNFIKAQLTAEYNNTASSLVITFEMLLHYIILNRSFRSFFTLVETDAIAFKDSILADLKKQGHYERLDSDGQTKLTAKYYNDTQQYLLKIGTQLYEFLKEYYIASKKGNFDSFFCRYSFMANQKSPMLSSDSLKCVIEKVYKEDFILIEAQRRTGLHSLAQKGILGAVLQNPEVRNAFKSGNVEDAYSLIKAK